MVLWSYNEARARGFAVDDRLVGDISSWVFGDMKTNSLSEEAPPRDVINLGWVYALLSSETSGDHNANNEEILSAQQTLVRQIVKKQAADGSWGKPLDERVPLGGPVQDIAILSRLALLESGNTFEPVDQCINRAAVWLHANQEKTSRQTRNLLLLMNTRESKPKPELEKADAAIISEQNLDGGWSQTADLPSDAYATGQTLYVLVRSGVQRNEARVQRGVNFLLKTQREDGSWPMLSRVNAKNLSPITAAGAAWAVLGLVQASY